MKKLLSLSVIFASLSSPMVFAEDQAVKSTDPQYANDSAMTNVSMENDDHRLIKSGFYMEPILFISKEDTSIKSSQISFINDDSSGNSKGYGVGLRFGGHVSEMFLLGLEGRFAKMQTDDSFYQKADSDVYNLGPMVGVQTPLFGVRLLASYIVAGENNPGSGLNGVDLKFKEAAGWRFGAGFYVAAVSVNLEYQDLTYNSTDIESIGSFAINDSTSVDASSKGYSLSVSFPIEL